MISCEHLLEFLTDYIEQTLSHKERSRFDEHLAVCPECVNYLRNFEATIRATRSAYGSAATREDAPVPEQLIQAILAARTAR